MIINEKKNKIIRHSYPSIKKYQGQKLSIIRNYKPKTEETEMNVSKFSKDLANSTDLSLFFGD